MKKIQTGYKTTIIHGLLLSTSLLQTPAIVAQENKVEPCETRSENDCPTTDNPAEITSININVLPIFDLTKPEENNFLFRWVNRLHIHTRKGVIKHDLLMKPGDKLDAKELTESERILRTRHYFREASVTAEETADKKTQVNVDAHEVWTLFPAISFSHRGGNSKFNFGLHDSNFLGYGKTVDIIHKSGNERSGNSFEYKDPNTGWHQTNLTLLYESNSDGKHQYYSFVRPYFSLTTINAMGVAYEQFDQEDILYDKGDEVYKYGHYGHKDEFFYGSKLGMSQGKNIHRINLGYTREEAEFSALPDELNLYPLPKDRDFHTPWIEYQYIRDNFIEAQNINQINRIEDINLGLQTRLRLGRAMSNNHNFDTGYQFSGQIDKGYAFNATNLLLAHIQFDSLYINNQVENGLITGQINYHWKNFEHGQFYVSLEASRGLRLFTDQPLILGGETGLRGYPANYEMGDKRYLATIEQRFYGQKEWFSLFHMGWAVFYDEGRAWGKSLIPQTQQDTVRDIGIGLRISGTRNGNRDGGGHNVLHLDLATPLDGGSDISNLQWLVKVEHSF